MSSDILISFPFTVSAFIEILLSAVHFFILVEEHIHASQRGSRRSIIFELFWIEVNKVIFFISLAGF